MKRGSEGFVKTIRTGYSPCPNDTFIFHAMTHGLIDTEGYEFEPVLEDVETLNRWAVAGELPLTKVSYGALGPLRPSYWCLRSGGALGRGCGPLVVAREAMPLEDLARGRIAVPGLHTTANLLLQLRLGPDVERVPLVFHEIMPAVARGEADAGVVIHEGRFTFPGYGLVAVEDLGEWWEVETGLPIPLGGILLRRDLEGVDPAVVQRVLRRSTEHALSDPTGAMDYVRRRAQELDEDVIREHIRLYVNEYSVDVGGGGQKAIETLLARGEEVGAFEHWEGELFPPET